MLAAEDPPEWRFGELRGGILADDPGLGKTVTMLALIVRSAGTQPAMPTEFWQTDEGWAQLRVNPVGHRKLLRVLNPLRKEFLGARLSPTAEAQVRSPITRPLAPQLFVLAPTALRIRRTSGCEDH
jgi:hypothetical protein